MDLALPPFLSGAAVAEAVCPLSFSDFSDGLSVEPSLLALIRRAFPFVNYDHVLYIFYMAGMFSALSFPVARLRPWVCSLWIRSSALVLARRIRRNSGSSSLSS